jgi:hypothetical protein
MFGAAWKILDLVLDFTIQSSPRIMDKLKLARAATPPQPFDHEKRLWGALVTTYEATIELRHGLIHRQAKVTPSRELRARNKHTNKEDSMSADQQLAFCRLAQRVVSCVLAASATPRDLFDISNQLRHLSSFSRHTTIIGRDVTEIYEIVDQLSVDDEMVRVDVPTLIADANQRFSDPVYIDLVGYVDDESTTVLTGALETAERRVYEFRLTDPPSWLHRETRLTS